MTRAFLFGKFLPFHKGHEAMIRYALTLCDHVSVLICCSDQENVSPETRKNWIEQTFGNTRSVEVLTYRYRESELPNTSETSSEVSHVWANIFKTIYPDVDLLITSEPYGKIVADYMNIRHASFDPERKQFPVSASRINADRFSYWGFLPDVVKPFYAVKIVILGTESTGKTTLTKQLAGHYRCSYVLETARDIIADSNAFTQQDLDRVVEEHTKNIVQAVRGDNAIVIIDTNLHTTESYSQFIFASVLKVDRNTYEENKADLYLYLNNDVPHYQDGTRLDERERNQLDLSHRKVLADHSITVREITGNWQERFEQALAYIDRLLTMLK